MVDRRLGFNPERDLSYDPERNLLFDSERDLSFDHEREMYFGKVGPVFRGQACPNCRNLVNPLEDTCRHCGGHVDPLRKVVPKKQPTRRKQTHKRQPKPKQRVEKVREPRPDEGAKQVCPNCSLKIPADSVYCPRCRVKLDEWRKYIKDLRRWESEQARTQQAQQYSYDRYYDVPRRRR
jgi:RNA polymerase subunit RPABC4/transcription elongation factor Spt4